MKVTVDPTSSYSTRNESVLPTCAKGQPLLLSVLLVNWLSSHFSSSTMLLSVAEESTLQHPHIQAHLIKSIISDILTSLLILLFVVQRIVQYYQRTSHWYIRNPEVSSMGLTGHVPICTTLSCTLSLQSVTMGHLGQTRQVSLRHTINTVHPV